MIGQQVEYIVVLGKQKLVRNTNDFDAKEAVKLINVLHLKLGKENKIYFLEPSTYKRMNVSMIELI